MATYDEEVRATFARMSADELLERFESGHLTEAARAIALAELATRGIDPNDPASIARHRAAEQSQRAEDPMLAENAVGRSIRLTLFIGMIPIGGFLAGRYVEADFHHQWLKVMEEQLGDKGRALVESGEFTLDRYCASPDPALESACATFHNVQYLQWASIGALVAGVALVAAIVGAARLAGTNRDLLASLFPPGIKFVLFTLFALIAVQGAIASYGVYILEANLVERVHYILVGSVAIGALFGAVAMIEAAKSMSQRPCAQVVGLTLSREEQPRLWRFVEDLAHALDARLPRQIVVGLDPNFFVTSADVAVVPGDAVYREETLYLSLPMLRILSQNELAAVIGHELGHFRGEDTKFSLRFYPVYRGTTQALEAISSEVRHGLRGLALLPALAILSLFLEKFATAERAIGRAREFEADKAGAAAANSRSVATSLLKIGVFATLWPAIYDAMVEALNRGQPYTNVSTLFADSASSSVRPELVDEVAQRSTVHPIDTHPPTWQRIEALGLEVSEVKDDVLQFDASSSSILLVEASVNLEEALTEIENRALAERGLANPAVLPGEPESAQTSSSGPQGLCPNCDRTIALDSSECPHCKALFGEGCAWKVEPLPQRE